jgi:hypothetical protein
LSRLGFLDLSGLLAAALAVVLDHEGDLVAFVERRDACDLECGGMDEDVLASVLRLDEAVACKYPPAKPGALDHEPPEAVDGVADAAPEICTA